MNKWDQFIWTPLHHAACAGHVEIIEMLLEAGAEVDAPALNGGTPLMRAIQSSRPSCVEVLIKAGADVNAVNKTGVSPNLKEKPNKNEWGNKSISPNPQSTQLRAGVVLIVCFPSASQVKPAWTLPKVSQTPGSLS